MKITFKKLTCLGLALVTTLSLAACGGTASSPKTDKTTEPEETVSPLAGTWTSVNFHANSIEQSFVIHDNGDMTDCKENELKLKSCEETSEGGYILKYTNGDNYEFVLDDNGNFGCYVYVTGGSDRYYYREADFNDYEVVTLTTANVTKYMEFLTDVSASTNNFGTPDQIGILYTLRFKDGLGGPSHIYGDPFWIWDVKNVTIHENADVTIGKTVTTRGPEMRDPAAAWETEYFNFGYEPSRGVNKQLYDYTPDQVIEVLFARITNGGEFIGQVYVPKGWNG